MPDGSRPDVTSSDATTADGTPIDPLDAASDVTVPPDAADAGDAGDAATTFCKTLSPAPTFCADFDDPTSPGAGWSGNNLGTGSTVTFATTTSVSAPRSLHVTTSQTFAQGGEAYLEASFPMNTQLSVEFDVRFASLPADGNPISPIILTPPVFPGKDIYWFVDVNDAYFQEYGTISGGRPQPSLNAWHHLTFAITTNGSSSTATTTVDGTTVWNNYALPYAWPSPTTATLRIGAPRNYAQVSDVYVDNVVVRAN